MRVVDLREIGRPERHREAELGQRVGERRRRRRRAGGRSRGPSAAATTARRARRRRRAAAPRSAAASGSRWRSTSAVTRVADRELDLRQAVALVHRGDQLAQRQQQRADVRRQHLADCPCRRRSSTCARGSRPAPCPSSPRSAPTAARDSVAPGRPLDRPQHLLGAAPCRGATGCPRARAAWSRPAPRRAGAASCSRRRCRSAGSAAPRAASSRAAAPSSTPVPSCSCGGAPATCTASPGSAPSMNTTLPSALCATPCAVEVERLDLQPFIRLRHGGNYPGGCSGPRRSGLRARGRRCYTSRRQERASVAEAAEGAGSTAEAGSNAQAKGLASASSEAFLAGERPASSGSTEGASGDRCGGRRQSLR